MIKALLGWIPIRFVSYEDPETGFVYTSWGTTTAKAQASLAKFLQDEPEIL